MKSQKGSDTMKCACEHLSQEWLKAKPETILEDNNRSWCVFLQCVAIVVILLLTDKQSGSGYLCAWYLMSLEWGAYTQLLVLQPLEQCKASFICNKMIHQVLFTKQVLNASNIYSNFKCQILLCYIKQL